MTATPKMPEWKRKLLNRLLIERIAWKALYHRNFRSYRECMQTLKYLQLELPNVHTRMELHIESGEVQP
jgi:hypothetical protein